VHAVASPPWRDEFLAEHFQRITALLHDHQALWRPQAFQHLHLPWEADLPELAQMLRHLDSARAEQLAEHDLELAEYLNPLLPVAQKLYSRCELPSLALASTLPSLFEARAVPGRKWRQIKAFAGHIPPDSGPLIEWCAGKAHLGRLLARIQQRSVTALEWNADLVAAGAALAQREKLPVLLHCADVMQASSSDFMRREHTVVALHACGRLHVELLRVCATHKPRTLVFAPCCYHLIDSNNYQPLSQLAGAADLTLTLTDLHTAVRDSVTSPQRVQQQRKTLQAWRLGFDIWQREVRGSDNYLPTQSQPLGIIKNGFAAFCRELAALSNLAPPLPARSEYYEQLGWSRLREVAALDLPRIVFRRALELWLILDRALYLREHGYAVEVGTFSERQLTPRNVAIRARLP
jgi:hypothetical protein